MCSGGFLLTADIDGDDGGKTIRTLEDIGGIDIDERASRYNSRGWNLRTAGTVTTDASTRSFNERGVLVCSYGADKSV